MKRLIYLLVLIPVLATSQGESKYLLDSLYQIEFDSPIDSSMIIRIYYRYDPSENTTSYTYLNSLDDEYSSMLNSFKTESAYDLQGNRILSICYSFDKSNNQWVYDYKTISEYTADGKLILTTK